MRRGIAIILSMVVILSAMAGCSAKNQVNETTSAEGLDAANNDMGFETVEVTDKNGETVTDKNGKPKTTEVNVEYVTDKKGNTIAKVVDKDGKPVKDKKGKDVTVDTDYKITTEPKTADPSKAPTKAKTEKSTNSTTMKPQNGEDKTKEDLTTVEADKGKVPSTSDKGTPVTFSNEDQQILKSMLEVPSLYLSSYENADGVPIDIASHAAIWMAEREGLTTSAFASGTIVLDLFKYFGQTVVNFKSKCNEESDNPNIVYVARNDSFSISKFEEKTHTVTINAIEDLGNNNYYKVTASVSGAKRIRSVTAVVQKNKLDPTLGFSIMGLKWR